MRGLSRQVIVYGVGGILNRLTGFLLIPLYTRYLTVSEYGLIALIAVWIQILTFVGLSGIASASVRFYYDDPSDDALQRKLFGNSTVLLLIWPLVFSALVLALTRAFDLSGLLGAGLLELFPFVVAIAFFTPLSRLLLGLFRAQGRAEAFVGFNLLFFVLQFVLIAWFVAIEERGLPGQVAGQTIANAIVFACSLALLIRYSRFNVDPDLMRKILAFGIPMIPFFLFVWVNTSAPRFFVQAASSLESVGLFFLATQFAGIILLAGTALNNALQPNFYQVAQEEDGAARLGKLITQFVAGFSVFAILIVAGAPYVIRFIAADTYHQSIDYVMLLSIAALLHVAASPVAWSLTYSKRTGYLSGVRLAGTAVLLIGLGICALEGSASIAGVAWTMIAASATVLLVGTVVAQRSYRVVLELGRISLILIAALVSMQLIDLLARTSSSLNNIYVVTSVAVLASATIYAASSRRSSEGL